MTSQSELKPKDQTFRNYSSQQAAKYANNRTTYSPVLIEYILKHHSATGGQTDVLLDVGCGPGNATRTISSHFSTVIGADPGEAMLQVASGLGGTTSTGAPIIWRTSAAEDIDKIPDLQPGSVDMITAATAAHWFHMSGFWEAAARLLKPGGTVAIWCNFPINENHLNPNSEKLHELFTHFTDVVLGPYVTPENLLVRDGYESLELPWDRPETAELYNKDAYHRRVWDSTKEIRDDEQGIFDSRAYQPIPIPVAEAMLGTMSPVTRWREAHPDLAGTDKDCIKVLFQQVCEIMGVPKGKEAEATIRGGMGLSLLCVKRA